RSPQYVGDELHLFAVPGEQPWAGAFKPFWSIDRLVDRKRRAELSLCPVCHLGFKFALPGPAVPGVLHPPRCAGPSHPHVTLRTGNRRRYEHASAPYTDLAAETERIDPVAARFLLFGNILRSRPRQVGVIRLRSMIDEPYGSSVRRHADEVDAPLRTCF